MLPSGPQTCRYELTYTFVKSNDHSSSVEYSVKVESDSNDTIGNEDEAYQQLAERIGDRIPNVKQDWEHGPVKVAFANAPWSDWDELEQVLESHPEVNSIRYDAPRPNNWHPARFILTVSEDCGDDVRLALEQYYAGLIPTVENSTTVVVVVSPLA